MHFMIYKITNLINGKIYIGAHKTDDLDDGYMGSGLLIRRSIEKYGLENFKKEIISHHDSEEQMYLTEGLIVDNEFLERDDVYNIMPGGHGGWTYVNNKQKYVNPTHTKEHMSMMSARMRALYNSDVISEWSSNGGKYTMLNKVGIFHPSNNSPFKGKQHTEESKLAISNKLKVASLGERNSQYGTTWITNDKENKKIKVTDPIPEGWKRGRVTKICS